MEGYPKLVPRQALLKHTLFLVVKRVALLARVSGDAIGGVVVVVISVEVG